MKKGYKLYVAYGSNLNKGQMRFRCPTAKLVGTGVIENYELQFKGHPHSAFATIAPKTGASVPVAVWEITKMDEARLDLYEGFPKHYFKENIPVSLGDKEVNAMVYIMDLKREFGVPTAHYYATVHEGYMDCGLPVHVLDDAIESSAKRYYKATLSKNQEYSLFSLCDNEEAEDIEDEESEDEEWTMTL